MRLIAMFLLITFAACAKPLTYKETPKFNYQSIDRTLTYREARRYMFGELFLSNGKVTDVYCGRDFGPEHGVGRNRIPNHRFINCEHTWPQSKFGNTSVEEKRVDLHHLFPSDSGANSSRSNLPFGEVRNGHRVCGDSYKGFLPNGKLGFEPPNIHKGNVARAMFYVSYIYHMPIDPQQESFLRQWHKDDPVDLDEAYRNKRIEEIQGISNPFIDRPDMVDRIRDF